MQAFKNYLEFFLLFFVKSAHCQVVGTGVAFFPWKSFEPTHNGQNSWLFSSGIIEYKNAKKLSKGYI